MSEYTNGIKGLQKGMLARLTYTDQDIWFFRDI